MSNQALRSVQRITPGSGALLDRHLDEVAPEIDELRDAVEETAGKGGRVRRRLTAAERKAVERRAMEETSERYEAEGWTVEDVSRTESFDLLCTRGDEELRVEVKGTVGRGARVPLTANEVEHARARFPHVALAVVSGIELDCRCTLPTAQGGELVRFEPWRIDDGELRAVAYEYVVPYES